MDSFFGISLSDQERQSWEKWAQIQGMDLEKFVKRGVNAYIYALRSKQKKAMNFKLKPNVSDT